MIHLYAHRGCRTPIVASRQLFYVGMRAPRSLEARIRLPGGRWATPVAHSLASVFCPDCGNAVSPPSAGRLRLLKVLP